MCSIENKIRSKIKENNFIRIDEFMNICLSDKEDGYYVKKTPIGSLGDFTTSPEISQLFGEIVALFIVNSINNNFSDIDKIQLIEIGAGKGTLADDVLRTLSKFPQIFKKISFVIIEISEELKKHQKAKLLKHNIDISWQENFHNLPNIPTVIYCNEFFDALPIRQFKYNCPKLKEKVIVEENDKLEFSLVEIDKEQSKKILSEYCQNIKYEEGDYLEISEETEKYASDIFNFLVKNKGMFLTFDYGYLSPSKKDSFQSIYKHKFNNPLDNIGNADLTAYVNFNKIVEIAKNIGIKNIFTQEQGKFLESMGIKILAEKLKNKSNIKASDIDASVSRLISHDEMGNIFKCLIVENY